MSKLVNQSRLQQFATKLWDKIKNRYDDAFINAEITESTVEEKKIKFTKRKGGATVDVDLADYARLQDRNKFKKDVSVDDAKVVSNANVGSINGTVPAGSRTTGYRRLTSKLFTDGYVKSLRVYLPTNTGNTINAHVWMIKKGASKAEDKFLEPRIIKAAPVITSGANKYIDVEIEREFTEETFFVIRTEGDQPIQGINNIKQEFRDDIINVNEQFNPQSTDTLANWDNYRPTYDLVGHMELHGRTGIVDISKRLDEIDTASGNYVKHSECTVQGGNASDNGKVVKLGTDGKLHESLMPKIAINEYYTVTTFDHDTLNGMEYENGDVVVVVTSGGQVTKRYLCIKKDKNPRDLTEGFVELNSKDGVVTSVNELRGDISLALVPEEEKIKLNIASGSTIKTLELPVISTTEIDTIITSLS